jgi:hypothetical protein
MKADEEEASYYIYIFFNTHAPLERKEAWTMPSAAMGAPSPWFEVRAQKPADGESETN